jgi:hypothetical protein
MEKFGFRFSTDKRGKPSIYFSGFYSQGDGASFSGTYYYAKNWKKEIEKEWKECPYIPYMEKIADEMRKTFYRHEFKILQGGFYDHSGTMSSYNNDFTEKQEDAILENFRSIADEFYSILEKEWEFLNSNESIDDTIIVNEYEFNEMGGIV